MNQDFHPLNPDPSQISRVSGAGISSIQTRTGGSIASAAGIRVSRISQAASYMALGPWGGAGHLNHIHVEPPKIPQPSTDMV